MFKFKFVTLTGGVYEVDALNKMIRRLEGDDTTKRCTAEWKQFHNILFMKDGGALIIWGSGRDEFSDTCRQGLQGQYQPGEIPDEERVRTTYTSPVIAFVADLPHVSDDLGSSAPAGV